MIHSRTPIFIVLILILIPTTVYWQVMHHDFVNYDDNIYVTENQQVKAGWTIKGLVMAFTANIHGHWHPLTWLSHMTDCQLFGLRPGLHHMTSLLLHLLNCLLLFFVFKMTTGEEIKSAFVAALFAIHPLHVETVAWIADRKDVLSTFFWMLTVWSYVRYAKRPRNTSYFLVVLFFALALMAKPMVVTLPLVLFLMDFWPLGRFHYGAQSGDSNLNGTGKPDSNTRMNLILRLLFEKIGLLFLAAGSAYITISVMQVERSVNMELSEWWRLDFLIFYVKYLGKTVWPFPLAVSYPYPEPLSWLQMAAAAGLLALISIAAVYWARKRPYLFVGWLWYLFTLLPVIGLLHGGPHRIADRYTYIPLIGLYVIISWGIPEMMAGWRYKKHILAILAGIALSALMALSWLQLRHWKNSVALFTHTVNVTVDNYSAHNNLGAALKRENRFEESIKHFRLALKIRPDIPEAHDNLAIALIQQGRLNEAIDHLQKAIQLRPDDAKFHNGLGTAFYLGGKSDEALACFSTSLRLNPENAETHNNLGMVLKDQGRLEEAAAQFSEAIKLEPENAQTCHNMGVTLAKLGKHKQALGYFLKAVRLNPDAAESRHNLAVALAQERRFEEAAVQLTYALRLRPDYTEARRNLEVVTRILKQQKCGKISRGENAQP